MKNISKNVFSKHLSDKHFQETNYTFQFKIGHVSLINKFTSLAVN